MDTDTQAHRHTLTLMHKQANTSKERRKSSITWENLNRMRNLIETGLMSKTRVR